MYFHFFRFWRPNHKFAMILSKQDCKCSFWAFKNSLCSIYYPQPRINRHQSGTMDKGAVCVRSICRDSRLCRLAACSGSPNRARWLANWEVAWYLHAKYRVHLHWWTGLHAWVTGSLLFDFWTICGQISCCSLGMSVIAAIIQVFNLGLHSFPVWGLKVYNIDLNLNVSLYFTNKISLAPHLWP